MSTVSRTKREFRCAIASNASSHREQASWVKRVSRGSVEEEEEEKEEDRDGIEENVNGTQRNLSYLGPKAICLIVLAHI